MAHLQQHPKTGPAKNGRNERIWKETEESCEVRECNDRSNQWKKERMNKIF